MLVIDREQEKEKWFDYDKDTKYLIKPFPILERSLNPSMTSTFSSILYKQAVYCLKDWKGVVDINGKEVPFSEDNMKFIFKYSQDIVQWVCVKSVEINNSIINLNQKKI